MAKLHLSVQNYKKIHFNEVAFIVRRISFGLFFGELGEDFFGAEWPGIFL